MEKCGFQIWVADVARCDERQVEAYCAAHLSDTDVAMAKQFMFPEDRKIFIVARALRQHVLQRLRPRASHAWNFEAGPHGRPDLVAQGGEPHLSLNVSHTEGLVAVAASDEAAIGIDVEVHGGTANGPQIAERFFAAEECSALLDLPAHERTARFTQLWTLKESLLKALGRGLSVPLRDVRFDFVGGSRLELLADGVPGLEGRHIASALIDCGPRHAMAISHVGPRPVTHLNLQLRTVVPFVSEEPAALRVLAGTHPLQA